MAEAAPDLFHKLQYLPLLAAVRERLSRFIGVKDADEVVLVPNASHGLNTILRDFTWDAEDTIVVCTFGGARGELRVGSGHAALTDDFHEGE